MKPVSKPTTLQHALSRPSPHIWACGDGRCRSCGGIKFSITMRNDQSGGFYCVTHKESGCPTEDEVKAVKHTWNPMGQCTKCGHKALWFGPDGEVSPNKVELSKEIGRKRGLSLTNAMKLVRSEVVVSNS